MVLVPLMAHPSTPSPHVWRFSVQVEAGERDTLRLHYAIEGNIEKLRIPAPAGADFTDELWKHTCLECFIKTPGGSAYTELNFSPSGEWAAYSFTDYRQGMAPLASREAEPKIVCCGHSDRLEVRVQTGPAGLGTPDENLLLLALCAVVEDIDGNLSYWSAAHAPERPDFHHPQGFVLNWPPEEVAS